MVDSHRHSPESINLMNDSEIVKYVIKNIEPLSDDIYGNRYRAAVYLKDGTYLPCVVFQSKRRQVELALRRFEELKDQKKQYRMIVESFVTDVSSVVYYNILKVETSPFALPLDVIREIDGETSMGWTDFVVEMIDGKKFRYGTTFSVEFFELPVDYNISDIKRIHRGVVDSGPENNRYAKCYREKPFFTCYIDGI